VENPNALSALNDPGALKDQLNAASKQYNPEQNKILNDDIT
jgi:hypothetical protein